MIRSALLALTLTLTLAPNAGLATDISRPDIVDPSSFRADRLTVSYETSALFDIGNRNDYFIVPQIATVGWQLDDIGNSGWLRGNTEFLFSGFFNPVLHGPESRFVGAAFGPRYNFVQPGSRWIPYIESRVGFCFTNSGTVRDAQGQDFCFTFFVGTGVRYLIDDHWQLSVGALYQHISNGGLSEPARKNSGLDILGPKLGLHYAF
ncbi:MAG: acyloxyacyl hydrolase [Verrucomicrobiia bacterium]